MPVRPEKLPGTNLNQRFKSARGCLVILLAAIPLLAAGCTSYSDNTVDPSGAVAASPQAFGGVDDTDMQRLADLWRTRTQAGTATDYKLGAGDLIQVSSPDIDDLKDRTERISQDGTISLPYVGTVKAGGMTESGLRDEIRHRLGKYVISPQVDLFVKDYQSRKVVVVGSVERPGLYDLTSGNDTIFDMITRAGGLKDSAAQRVLLITEAASHAGTPPAGYEPSRARPNQDFMPASNQPLTATRAASYLTAGSLKDADPIVVDLKNLERGGNQLYLAMPARPGDIIVIPDAGEVLIQGWVQKPGDYKITSGMTLMGAIAAAGGALFAADTTSVKILRSDKRGEKQILVADLNKIDSRAEQDVELHGGDVVTVPYSTAKIGPYAIYSLLSRAYVGASAPFIP